MAQLVSEHSTVVAAKEQVSCDLAGEAIILNLKSGVYYGLDPVGARIWSLIQEPTAVRNIQNTIVQEYDVEADQCEGDLLALLEDMAAHGLIEVKNGKHT